MKKVIKRVLLGILLVLILAIGVFIAGAWSMFGEKVTAAMTVTKISDGLYSMSYEGDYGFDAYVEQGGGSNAEEMGEYITNFLSGGFYAVDTSVMEDCVMACSTITAKDADGNMLFGRNYDWSDCKTMIVHTKPDNGYESVSTVCLDFLGFGEEWYPETDMMSKIMSLSAIYIPLDGMNEKGLCIADLVAGDAELTHQDNGKVDLTTTASIRRILDHAATVDEAITLLEDTDMHSDIGVSHHLSISDATGKSVVVEYVNGEMFVHETVAVTNHYIAPSEKEGVGHESSHARYNLLVDLHAQNDGVMSEEQVKYALQQVTQRGPAKEYEGTMWSIICDPAKQQITFYFKVDYENPYVVSLKDFAVTAN